MVDEVAFINVQQQMNTRHHQQKIKTTMYYICSRPQYREMNTYFSVDQNDDSLLQLYTTVPPHEVS